jgi:GrpB-like predicted nucleotidyltransferase (UPF0157 family)
VAAVEIVGPSDAWAGDFRTIGRRLRAELGTLALRIDHIGSPAVPGLAAKDVVDVQVSSVSRSERRCSGARPG